MEFIVKEISILFKIKIQRFVTENTQNLFDCSFKPPYQRPLGVGEGSIRLSRASPLTSGGHQRASHTKKIYYRKSKIQAFLKNLVLIFFCGLYF